MHLKRAQEENFYSDAWYFYMDRVDVVRVVDAVRKMYLIMKHYELEL